jgi:hypothetical protein
MLTALQVGQVHGRWKLSGLLLEKVHDPDYHRGIAVPLSRIIERQVEQGFAGNSNCSVRLRPIILKQLKPADLPQARDTAERLAQTELQ